MVACLSNRENEQLCPIHLERVAPRFCAAGEWNVKCKVSPLASQTAGRGCLAKSSAQKTAGPSEFVELVQWGASTFHLPHSFRRLSFSRIAWTDSVEAM